MYDEPTVKYINKLCMNDLAVSRSYLDGLNFGDYYLWFEIEDQIKYALSKSFNVPLYDGTEIRLIKMANTFMATITDDRWLVMTFAGASRQGWRSQIWNMLTETATPDVRDGLPSLDIFPNAPLIFVREDEENITSQLPWLDKIIYLIGWSLLKPIEFRGWLGEMKSIAKKNEKHLEP